MLERLGGYTPLLTTERFLVQHLVGFKILLFLKTKKRKISTFVLNGEVVRCRGKAKSTVYDTQEDGYDLLQLLSKRRFKHKQTKEIGV